MKNMLTLMENMTLFQEETDSEILEKTNESHVNKKKDEMDEKLTLIIII